MKKVAFLGVVVILLAALAVPAMAKSPNHGNGNGANAGQQSSTEVSSANQNEGNQTNHHNQQDQGNHGNHGARGNGNQGQTHPNTPFYLQGIINSVDVDIDTKTITVTLTHGNAMVKQFIGSDLTIKATGATQIYKITQGVDDESDGGESETTELSSAETTSNSEATTNEEGDSNRVAIPFDQLTVGQRVAIHGNLVKGVYTARLITMYIQTPVGESTGE
jgi:hypothetical protein